MRASKSIRFITVGEHFGRWTIVSRAATKRRAMFRCRCDCGVEREVAGNNLIRGVSSSCGCGKSAAIRSAKFLHGMNQSNRTYRIWIAMNQRCANPKQRNWSRYGGRGVAVCDEWRASFLAFLRDMGEAPLGLSIDRIDNDGPYCKQNCRWATNIMQARNKSQNRWIEHSGERLLLSDWAARLSLPSSVLTKRLRRGWSIEDALTKPSLRKAA